MRAWLLPAIVLAAACAMACADDPGSDAIDAQSTRLQGDPPLPGIERPDSELAAKLDKAWKAKGTGYSPRTHHVSSDGSPKYTNRLILETSPYLLQHAHNPVNWYPWGDEAFERAARDGKPVLLSIGYSTCHWCHVMERESYEDEEIARFLNEKFVAIKVDREERPDVDDVYMQAVQIMVGGGGWPLNVMLTPEREPFFGGTYFPPRDGARGAQHGFLSILRELSALYVRDPQRVVEQANLLSARMREGARAQPPADVPGGEAIYLAASRLARSFDSEWGGFGPAPKFPQPSVLELLLRYFRHTNDPQALHMTVRTLEKMAAGGMYDHVGGGFHRYSTDRTWLVPHFEKMLYDNAQLAGVYLDAYQITRVEEFARIARHTLDYVAREMTAPDGAFYSATDADSETPGGTQAEGWFFTWTPEEIEAAVGAQRARLVGEYYGVTDAGNFEGRSILHTTRPLPDVAAALGLPVTELASELDAARLLLYEARLKRPAPLRDEKTLTSWNGLMISAFARAAFVLDSPEYAESARRAARFILERMRDADGRLYRSFKDGRARHAGYLDDYAFFVQGLLDLYEATWEVPWLEAAVELQERLDERYLDEAAGGYFLTAKDAEALLVRSKPAFDGAEPSGNSIALLNLLRLEELTTDDSYRARADHVLEAFAASLKSGSPAATKMLSALDYYLDEPLEVLIVSADGDDTTRATLVDVARMTYFPNRIFSVAANTEERKRQADMIPLLEDKRPRGGRTTAYVCKKGYCELPTSDPAKLAQQLLTVEPLLDEGEPPPLPAMNARAQPNAEQMRSAPAETVDQGARSGCRLPE